MLRPPLWQRPRVSERPRSLEPTLLLRCGDPGRRATPPAGSKYHRPQSWGNCRLRGCPTSRGGRAGATPAGFTLPRRARMLSSAPREGLRTILSISSIGSRPRRGSQRAAGRCACNGCAPQQTLRSRAQVSVWLPQGEPRSGYKDCENPLPGVASYLARWHRGPAPRPSPAPPPRSLHAHQHVEEVHPAGRGEAPADSRRPGMAVHLGVVGLPRYPALRLRSRRSTTRNRSTTRSPTSCWLSPGWATPGARAAPPERRVQPHLTVHQLEPQLS